MTTPQLLDTRALNRATLARQLLLERADIGAAAAVEHVVGLQAQNVRPPYVALAARVEGFDPEELSGLMAERKVVRIVTLRSTIHLHTADDCMTLRPLVQPARERELKMFLRRMPGVDLDRLTELTRTYVEEEPRTMKQIRELLLREWPDADPSALGVAARCRLPLVQVTPRGLWRRSGQVALTTAGRWLGRPASEAATPDAVVLRYLAAFGPASVKDMQQWAGLTRMKEVFERLRPRLLTFRDAATGVELFDLPDAPRPAPDAPAPPRFLPEFDNLLLSHADRTRVVPPAFKDRTWKGNQAFSVLLYDGTVAGVWKLTEGGGGTALVVELFARSTVRERDEIAAEGERTLRTLGAPGPYDIGFGQVMPRQ